MNITIEGLYYEYATDLALFLADHNIPHWTAANEDGNLDVHIPQSWKLEMKYHGDDIEQWIVFQVGSNKNDSISIDVADFVKLEIV